MKVKLNVLVFGLSALVLLLSGCCRKVTRSTERTFIDSSWTVEKITMKPVAIPGDSLTFSFPLVIDPVTKEVKPTTYKAKSARAGIDIEVKDGKITGTANCDEFIAQVAEKEREIGRLQKETQKETIVITKYRSYWFDWIGRTLTLLLIIILIIKIKNFFTL